MKRIILITGGERSGKSSHAESMALSLSPNPIYMATAHIWDEEFSQRVKHHKERRGPQWTNIEEERTLSAHNVQGRVALVDCLTLWATNYYSENVTENSAPQIAPILQELKNEFDRFTNQEATFIFVTNEIGLGGVSTSIVQRRFTDLLGWLNQYIAGKADEVYLMVSGIPLKIK